MVPAEYFKVRLEHTLQHTQQSTRLIYLVNGAVLAMLYFIAKLQELGPYRQHAMAIILGILAIINLIHACLIKRQGSWYAVIDRAFAASVEAKRIERPKGFPWLGTHDLYASVHFIVTAALAVAAVAAWLALP